MLRRSWSLALLAGLTALLLLPDESEACRRRRGGATYSTQYVIVTPGYYRPGGMYLVPQRPRAELIPPPKTKDEEKKPKTPDQKDEN